MALVVLTAATALEVGGDYLDPPGHEIALRSRVSRHRAAPPGHKGVLLLRRRVGAAALLRNRQGEEGATRSHLIEQPWGEPILHDPFETIAAPLYPIRVERLPAFLLQPLQGLHHIEVVTHHSRPGLYRVHPPAEFGGRERIQGNSPPPDAAERRCRPGSRLRRRNPRPARSPSLNRSARDRGRRRRASRGPVRHCPFRQPRWRRAPRQAACPRYPRSIGTSHAPAALADRAT
jgi:hypothetical protein